MRFYYGCILITKIILSIFCSKKMTNPLQLTSEIIQITKLPYALIVKFVTVGLIYVYGLRHEKAIITEYLPESQGIKSPATHRYTNFCPREELAEIFRHFGFFDMIGKTVLLTESYEFFS